MTTDSTSRSPDSIGRHVVPVLSLLATPFLLFLASACTLYLKNQAVFLNQIRVMEPFFALFVSIFAAGIAIYALSNHRPFQMLLLAYYLAAPFFLLFVSLQNWSMGSYLFLWIFSTWAGVLVYVTAYVSTVVFLSPRLPPSRLSGPFSVFGLLLLAAQAHSLVMHLEPAAPQSPETSLPAAQPSELPNVYHLILDGYDAGQFPRTLSSDYRRALSGFVNFPKNVALYPETRMSLASIFSGRRQGEEVSGPDYMERAFNSHGSFLYWLKKAGYTTLAYGPQMYEFELGLFDRVIYHRHNLQRDSLLEFNTATFKRLWLWVNAPRWFTNLLLSTDWFIHYGGQDLSLVENGNFLPFSAPLMSYLSFASLLERESELPAQGRYTFIHLAIPHQPEVFTAECSYDEGGRKTGQLEQAACATKLLVLFVDRLKELGRFDDSLVIAHADHGIYELESGAPSHSPERVSLRALLLIKPIGRRVPLAFSDVRSAVTDIAPTLLEALDIHHQLQTEGTSLLPSISASTPIDSQSGGRP